MSVCPPVINPIARSTKRHTKENYKRLHLRVSESCFVIYPIAPQHKALNDFELELLGLIQTHMIQNPMLYVEVGTRALRASQNEKKRDACLVCSLCLSGYMGVFSEDVGWLAYFV
jgi:hypothetical protein